MRHIMKMEIAACAVALIVGATLPIHQASALTSCSGQRYRVTAGDTCPRVYARIYCNRASLFIKFNGRPCTNHHLFVGQTLCHPAKC
jgi:hypothetical protein